MGRFFSGMSTVVAPARMRASAGDPFDDRYYMPAFWAASLSALGTEVTPELALTLSYVYCAVDTISADFGTMTCQTFEDLGNDGRARVSYSTPGIGVLARMLRWQPNAWQTSKAFWSTLAWQYLLRPAAYAEQIYRPGGNGFLAQLIPRHPDRVHEERLPSGRVQFKLTEANGKPRTVTQDEMFVVRNTSVTGLNALSRTEYGSKALASALTLQHFTSQYFKKGATAALLATYKGHDMEDEDEDALHASITRYMSGAENAGGLLLVPEDIDVKALGVDPEKAQLLGLKNLSGRDVARLFKMPPSWLAIEGAAGYASQVQDAENYKNRCQVPMVVEFEQAIQRDLILAVNRYFVKFNMDYLTRADLLTRMQAYEIGIRSRVIRPSEARIREDMSPDEALDKLSEGDFRPGTSGGTGKPGSQPEQGQVARSDRASFKAMLAVHDNAVRCLRRERAAVEKLAKKHASDPSGWQAGLRDFYGDHARFVSETMRLNPVLARGYAAQHGSEFEAKGVGIIDGLAGQDWERFEADELAALALSEGDTIDDWFNRRLVDVRTPPANHITVPVTIAEGAVQSHTTVEGATIQPAAVTIAKGAVQVDARTTVEGARVDVKPAAVTIAEGAIRVESPPPVIVAVDKHVTLDAAGKMQSVREVHTTETGDQIIVNKTAIRDAAGHLVDVQERRTTTEKE